jgi:hypothetical protein
MRKLLSVLVIILTTASAFAQGPPVSAKLKKDNGLGVLKLGTPFDKVKSLCEPAADKKSWNSTDGKSSETEEVWVVKKGSKGFTEFCGKPVERVEVIVMESYDEHDKVTKVVGKVLLYIKRGDELAISDWFVKALDMYEQPITMINNIPDGGERIYAWYGDNLFLNMTSYTGEESKPGHTYMVAEFVSEKGF